MFDTTLNPLGLSFAVDENPERPTIQIVVAVGAFAPVEVAPGQPLIIQTGTYRIPVPKDLMIDFAKKTGDAAEALPDPVEKPDILIAGDLDDAKVRAAQRAEQVFRGGPDGP